MAHQRHARIWLRAAFPGCLVEDQGLYHPGTDYQESAGGFDACYSGKLLLPTLAPHEGQHALHFRSSFLASYYLLYIRRTLYVPRTGERGGYDPREEARFTLTPEEEPFARVVAAEIEATFGGEPLPPAVGLTIVPELAVLDRSAGYVTIHQCLFELEERGDRWA
jgi:hypothetical protein